MARTTRRRLLTSLAAAALATTAACAPIMTQQPYDPGDGVSVQLGDRDEVRLVNLLVLTEAEGSPGVLIGAATNRGSEPVELTVQVADAEASLELAPGETLRWGDSQNDPVQIGSVTAPPGAVIEVTASTPAHGSASVPTPVLDGTLTEYASLLP